MKDLIILTSECDFGEHCKDNEVIIITNRELTKEELAGRVILTQSYPASAMINGKPGIFYRLRNN